MQLIRALILAFIMLANATVPAMIRDWKPSIIDKWLHVTQDGYQGVVRYHSRGNMSPKIIVIHVQEGSNRGSWIHFHSVLASSTVLIGKLGDIWNLVHKSLAPWTNGDTKSPSYFMQTILNRWGWNSNTYSLTIEREGFSRERTDAQDKSIVWQVWQWMQEFKIEAIYIVGHYDVNGVDKVNCPDPPPHPLVSMIKNAVSGTGVPVIDETTPGHDLVRSPWRVVDANGIVWNGEKNITVNDIVFYAEKRTVRVSGDGLRKRQWASTTANLVGTSVANAHLAAGTVVNVLGWVEGEEVSGERRWWVLTSGERIWAGGTFEKPSAPAPEPTKPDDGISHPDQGNNRDAIPVLLNGNTYYPVDARDEAGAIRRPVRTLTNANVRMWAATHSNSPVLRTLPKGTKIWITHWVRGEPVDIAGYTHSINRDVWYVIEHESGDGIRKGGRIWSGLIELL